MIIEIPESWPDYVAGLYGITVEAKRALNVLIHLPQDRLSVFHAAMSGRGWMYRYQAAATKLPGLCEPGDYWRSVIEAVAMARKATDCQKEVAWFLEPIPDSQPHWASPTTLAAGMEVV